MLTDSPTRKNRAHFLESDRIKTLDLPPNGDLPDIAQRLESAMKADKIRDVRSACAEFLTMASSFFTSLRTDSSRLGMIPKDRTSPSGSATATAIVSAWTSKPRNHTFFMEPVPFRFWLCVVVTRLTM